MSAYETIGYGVEEGIAEIILDRPDVLNAFNRTLIRELTDALQEAHDDDSVYVVILSGAGRAFCAGVDIDMSLAPQSDDGDEMQRGAYLWTVENVSQLLYRGSKPTIAALNGLAVGGGFGFAIACDLRVMDESTWMRVQELGIGVVPGIEAYILPRLVGEGRARELLFLNDDISPEYAYELGLVNEIADEGEALAEARNMARKIRDHPAQGVRYTKRLLSGPYESLEEIATAAGEFDQQALHDPERIEALSAWQEDREPQFDREY